MKIISDYRSVKVDLAFPRNDPERWLNNSRFYGDPESLFMPRDAQVIYQDGRREVSVHGRLIKKDGELHANREGGWSSRGEPDETWPQVAVDTLALVEGDPADTCQPGDPDPTRPIPGYCAGISIDGTDLECTRPAGHGGQHVAGTGDRVAGVWPNASAPDGA